MLPQSPTPPLLRLQTTRLDNGVLVASQDDGAPVASLAITVAAGYRHETHANAGVVHYLRNVAFQVRPSFAANEQLGRHSYAPFY